MPPRALFLLAFLAGPAFADTVYLKNGNAIEGIVQSQDDAQVVVDMGYGTTTLERADVARVVVANRAALAGAIQSRRFESGEGVPSAAKPLDALLRRAESLREDAVDARQRLQELADERVRIQERRRGLLDDERRLNEQIKRLGGDLRGNADVASRYNMVQADRRADSLRLDQIGGEEDAQREHMHAYLEAVSDLRKMADGHRGWLAKQKGPYYAWLRPRLKAATSGVVRDTIADLGGGKDSVIVKALINGRVEGRFLVDTGATMTLIYKSLAKDLALGKDRRIGVGKTKVADGRTVDCDIVLLDSISVGNSTAQATEAAVVPMNMPGIDGLLGMSFLKRFVTRVDGAHGRLILEDVK